MDERRERRLRRMLGTDEPITDGFFVSPPANPTLLDAVPVPDIVAGVILVGVGIASAVGAVRRRLGGDGLVDRPPTDLPSKPLAVALVGDEFLIGRRGKILRRVPEQDLLTSLRRPKLAAELEIDGQQFVAGGVEGDVALRLQRTRRERAGPAEPQA